MWHWRLRHSKFWCSELVEEIYSEEVWEMLQAELKAVLKVAQLGKELILLPVSQLHFHHGEVPGFLCMQRYLQENTNALF